MKRIAGVSAHSVKGEAIGQTSVGRTQRILGTMDLRNPQRWTKRRKEEKEKESG
jgi:hypothetical protein